MKNFKNFKINMEVKKILKYKSYFFRKNVALDISMLKPMVNNYTSEWNQVIQSLMDGSNEGNLQSNGQTWEEETTNPGNLNF